MSNTKTKRERNRKQMPRELSSRGIPFESSNEGAHLIIDGGAVGMIDFWPGTLKWIPRRDKKHKGKSFNTLIDYLSNPADSLFSALQEKLFYFGQGVQFVMSAEGWDIYDEPNEEILISGKTEQDIIDWLECSERERNQNE